MTHALITGANRGIGLELARLLKAQGVSVTAVCRKPSAELSDLGVRIESGVDVSDDGAVSALAKRLDGEEIDILINNAGILRAERLGALDAASISEQFAVNALAPLRVSEALLPMMRDGGKIIIVTSRMGSIADNGSGGYYGYRMSKAAVNAAGVSLAHDVKNRGIAVLLVHPGMVATEMTGRNGIPPADAARGILARVDELTLETSGQFRHAGTGEVLPW